METGMTLKLHIAFSITLLLALTGSTSAQIRTPEFRIHDRGQVWETMKDNGLIGAPNPTNRFEYYPSLDWPGGPHALVNKDEQRSYSYQAGMWIGGKKAGSQVFFTENGPFTYVDNGTFSPMQKQTNFIGGASFNPSEAEETITAEWTTTEGMRVRRISRSWSPPGYDTFILIEYQVTNQTTSPMSEVFIGFPYLLRPSYQDFVVHNGWGDDLNRADELVGYDSTLAMMYAFDDTPNFSIPSDVGNFWASANELRTTGYAGVALIAADAATGGRPQPANILFAQLLGNERNLTLTNVTPARMYDVLTGTDRSLQTTPDQRLCPFMLMSCGPYEIPAGGVITVVLAQGVNGLPISEAMKGIAAQTALPAGLDSIKATMSRARQVHANNYRLPAFPPPSPDAEFIALPSSRAIALTWPPIEDTYANPETGARNLRGYRIYRSNRSFVGPYSVLRTINAHSSLDRTRFFDADLGKWRVLDQTIDLGVTYFYAVTSFDSLGRESGFTNRNETGIAAAAPPAPNASDVRVFPNPFREVSGFPTSGEESSIVWTNLPGQATVRIFTSSGELVKTIKHESTTSGQVVWNQLSDARQRVASGIYFWTVESPVGSSRGTLLIIK